MLCPAQKGVRAPVLVGKDCRGIHVIEGFEERAMLQEQPPAEPSYLETAKAAPSRQGDIADVRGAVGRDHLVHHKGSIFQISST